MDNFDQEYQPDPAAEALKRAQFAARRHEVTRRWPFILVALVVGGAVGYGASFAMKPRFMSATVFIPPQQQGSAATALASLGALSGLVGGAGIKNSLDQYISMMQSVTVADRIIARFGLRDVYETKYMEETRKLLAKNVQITSGKKDGLIRVEVEDTDPKRAAAMADQFVLELRFMTSRLAVTEAQQRRAFFEHLVNDTKQRLIEAQVAVESSGINAGTVKAEPRSAADAYGRLRAEWTAAQVRLQVMHGSLADTSPQVGEQANTVKALGDQLRLLEVTQSSAESTPGYISRYRDFKYQETLFDLYSKQYELARLDESREGSLIQVVDGAQVAERKHSPRRSMFAAVTGLLFAAALGALLWRRAAPPGSVT